jgi:hypothetical protein
VDARGNSLLCPLLNPALVKPRMHAQAEAIQLHVFIVRENFPPISRPKKLI